MINYEICLVLDVFFVVSHRIGPGESLSEHDVVLRSNEYQSRSIEGSNVIYRATDTQIIASSSIKGGTELRVAFPPQYWIIELLKNPLYHSIPRTTAISCDSFLRQSILADSDHAAQVYMNRISRSFPFLWERPSHGDLANWSRERRITTKLLNLGVSYEEMDTIRAVFVAAAIDLDSIDNSCIEYVQGVSVSVLI